MSRGCLAAALGVVALLACGQPSAPIASASRRLPAASPVIARQLVWNATQEDGAHVVAEVDEIRRVEGRIGFLRSPALDGVEARGVRLFRGGALVASRERIRVSGPLPRAGLEARPAEQRQEAELLLDLARAVLRADAGSDAE
jgi:hypothetical protein